MDQEQIVADVVKVMKDLGNPAIIAQNVLMAAAMGVGAFIYGRNAFAGFKIKIGK